MRSSRRRLLRSHKRLIAGVIVVVLALLAGGADVAYANVKSRVDQLQSALTANLQAGQKELEAGKTSLSQANARHDVALAAQASEHFVAAKTQFLGAGKLADGSRLLQGLEAAPGVGSLARSRHTAVDGIAGMGAALSDAGKELSVLDSQLLKPSANGQAGQSLLTALGQAQSSLAGVRLDLVRAQQAAAGVDVEVVPSGQQATFVKARDTIASSILGLDEFGGLVPILEEVLGANGPRNYLVEQVNPAELRAGGGFIGTYSLLRADRGVITVVNSGSAYDLAEPRPLPGQPGFIPIPSPYREVIPWVSWSFVDSNIFPDFASNARAAEAFVNPRLGLNVDGVISMDYFTVAEMLELTGPMSVPGFGLTVSANDFIPQMIRHELADTGQHKAVLSALAGPLLQRVTSFPPGQWPTLLAALNGLAAQRHLQAYFNSPTVQNELDRVSWSGSVNPSAKREFMMEVESNYFGTKTNYFLSRRYTVLLTRQGALLHHTIVVDLVNNEPYGTEGRVTYKADTRLFVGAIASAGIDNLRTVSYPNPVPPAGSKVLDGWLDVTCCGGTSQAVFQYDTQWPTSDRGRNEIYWQKQPGTAGDAISVTWNDGHGHTYTVNSDLSQDRVIHLSPSGVALTAGSPAQATLPSLSLG